MTHRMRSSRVVTGLTVVIAFVIAGCSAGSEENSNGAGSASVPALLAGAASRSILPTVGRSTDYAAGLSALGSDNVDAGRFVERFDHGRIDVGNGEANARWVRDDLRVSALALQHRDRTIVLVSVDLYMVFRVDGEAITTQARAELDREHRDATIVVSATHNHHGPDTAFSVNDDWYQHVADQATDAIVEAVGSLQPVEMVAATGEHTFGVNDTRDPVIVDPRLNVAQFRSVDGDDPVATVVQWTNHPEVTLGFEPDPDRTDCTPSGDEDCRTGGRYLLVSAAPVRIDGLDWKSKSFFTRLTNIGFRALLGQGDLGWKSPSLFVCEAGRPPSERTCRDDGGATEDDPLLAQFGVGPIRVGEFFQVPISYLDFGSVGMLFLPGELPPELVIGLPEDFDTNPDRYYRQRGSDGRPTSAVGADYEIPGALLDLIDDEVVFTIGLGGEEIGYFVPLSDFRVACSLDVLGEEGACRSLFERGLIDHPDGIAGSTCKRITDDPSGQLSARHRLPRCPLADHQRSSIHLGWAIGSRFSGPELPSEAVTW